MTQNYNILIKKLDAFIRKYYKNQILKGLIYSIATLVVFFLIINFLEYFAYFETGIRTFMFYLYLIISALIIVNLILIPLFKLFRIGKIISHEQAAVIIGKYFPDVADKLLNTLQLKDLFDRSDSNAGLLEASIDQKISRLRPIPFSSAIDLKENRKYLKYVVPPLLFLIVFLVAAPTIITDPAKRIIKHNEHFEREAPFEIVLLNEKLEAVQQDDFTVKIKIVGEVAPDKVHITTRGLPYQMKKESPVEFVHTFRNLQENLTFRIDAGEVLSELYTINVLPKPIVLNFNVALDYPTYTGKTDETLENTGDIIAPEGTRISWKFYTRDTDGLDLFLGDSLYEISGNKSNVFEFSQSFFHSQVYAVNTYNSYLRNKDSLLFAISIIPDLYPTITIEEFNDSIESTRLYFRGYIKDDYGFKKLSFSYKKTGTNDSVSRDSFTSEAIRLNSKVNQQQFFHFFDLSQLALKPGDEVEYFFEVWDNDEINGSKSSRSQKMIFKVPSLEEFEEKTAAANEQVKDDMENLLKDLQLLQNDIDELNKNLFDKKTLNWQEKQQIQDLLNRRKSIEEQINDLQKLNEQKLNDEQKFKEFDEDLLKKQEELQKLMEELLTDDMKKLMEEIQKLLDELDKDKVNEMMEEMKMSNEELENQLDRTLELFKQLEFEQKLQETIDKLNELAKKQEELSEETNKSDENENDQLKDKQDELNKEFEDIRKDLNDLEKQNQELENPNQMDSTEPEEQEVEELMEESSEQLEQQKNSKASESQKGASQKMQELSQKLQQMMEAMQMEQMGEDINMLREILENLIQLSFDQEDLMNRYSETTNSDPKYLTYINEQKNLQDDMDMIADSLYALAKRQIMIQPIVNKEISNINRNIDKSIESINDRRKGNALESQQYVMTSINNLALLLAEALQQMQQQMMQMQSMSSSSCPNPGSPGGSQQMKSMQQLQQQLNQQLQQMREGKTPGKKKGNSDQGMSEQLARLAAQQSAIRKQMEEFRDQLKEEGRGNNGDVAKMLEDMEKTEKDIVNNNITQETLKRQQEILTRLLKSEKAEQQREEEQRRESQEASDPKISNPDILFEYDKIRNREVELLKTVPPNLNPFYKSKVTQYFFRFN
nr:DUF4175 domain-containing protein [Bacteroidota bacterium]